MGVFDALILGIVEGITEFLPISSTAHLILASNLLYLEQTEFQKSFEIIIQLGAILAVIVLYGKKFITNLELTKRVIVAFIPTGVIGLVLYKIVKTYLLGNTNVVLWSLLIGGVILVAFEMFHREKVGTEDVDVLAKLSYKNCLLIGCFQSLAIIPGVSRSAATILGGLWLGVPRKAIVQFSFLLAVPTMLAATGLDLVKHYSAFSSPDAAALAVGFAAAFAVATLCIHWLLKYVANHDFKAFGIYRIAVATLFFLFF